MTKKTTTEPAGNGLLTVNPRSTVAMYEQIKNQIEFAIASGRVKENEQLPAVRKLSLDAALNMNTVAKSYRDLEVMGLVFTRKGVGIYVAKGAQKRAAERSGEYVAAKLSEAAREARALGMTLAQATKCVERHFTSDAAVY